MSSERFVPATMFWKARGLVCQPLKPVVLQLANTLSSLPLTQFTMIYSGRVNLSVRIRVAYIMFTFSRI